MPRPDPDHDIWDFSARSLAGLNGLAPSSRGPQLAALEAIARRSTQVLTAETMPWHRLRRPHVLKIRSLLEENYLQRKMRLWAALLESELDTWYPTWLPDRFEPRLGPRHHAAGSGTGKEGSDADS
jgi:hypothetical protein